MKSVACIKFSRETAVFAFKVVRDIKEGIAVFFGIIFEQTVKVVDVFVGQIRHRLMFPPGYRQDALNDNFAVRGSFSELIHQNVVFIHKFFFAHQRDSVDAKSNQDAVRLAFFHCFFDGKIFAVWL